MSYEKKEKRIFAGEACEAGKNRKYEEDYSVDENHDVGKKTEFDEAYKDIRLQIYISGSFDPYENLARELYLTEDAEPGVITLYLWQNEKTVVIGRNQNAWRECRTTELARAGGRLARRLSGGGAVYHDIGNLNFTFLAHEADYSVDRQLRVIEAAAGMLGVPAKRSGRNDILADGRKFSGNAFYKHKQRAYHHGTLLVRTNSNEMSRFLRPSRAKLESKGVASVKSRVVNLSELNSKITVENLKKALQSAFQKVYSDCFLTEKAHSGSISSENIENEDVKNSLIPLIYLTDSYFDAERLEKYRMHFADENWIYGRKMKFDISFEKRFDWGEIGIKLKISDAVITEISVDTDAMEWEIAPFLESSLKGCKFSENEMIIAISSEFKNHFPESELDSTSEDWERKLKMSAVVSDICTLIREQNI